MRIRDVLEYEHEQLDQLLRAPFDPSRFAHFRAQLLRHIGIEEKILIAGARRRCVSIPDVGRIREDHAVVGMLLVPTPDEAIAAEIRGVLVDHEALEEAQGGLFDVCDDLFGPELPEVIHRIAATKAPPLAPHFDGPGTHRTAAAARAALGRSRKLTG